MERNREEWKERSGAREQTASKALALACDFRNFVTAPHNHFFCLPPFPHKAFNVICFIYSLDNGCLQVQVFVIKYTRRQLPLSPGYQPYLTGYFISSQVPPDQRKGASSEMAFPLATAATRVSPMERSSYHICRHFDPPWWWW